MVVAPVMPLERRCQYKLFCFCIPASVKNMGSAAAVLVCFGGGVAPVLKLDRRQGSVTNAKTLVRRGEFTVSSAVKRKIVFFFTAEFGHFL